MITVAKFWLTDAHARAILASHDLGQAYRRQLHKAYQRLRVLEKRRGDARALLRRLGTLLVALDERHDNKARAVYHVLLALRAGDDDPAVRELCGQLLERFFPHGLRFIKWSYVDEGGWAESMSQLMNPELRARLAGVTVGSHNLAELFDAWFEAGMELGQKALERSRLESTLAASGASTEAIDARGERYRWIRTVQTFIQSLELMELTATQREALLSPLEHAIAVAERRRSSGESKTPDDDVPGDDVPGDDHGDPGAAPPSGSSAPENQPSGTFSPAAAASESASSSASAVESGAAAASGLPVASGFGFTIQVAPSGGVCPGSPAHCRFDTTR